MKKVSLLILACLAVFMVVVAFRLIRAPHATRASDCPTHGGIVTRGYGTSRIPTSEAAVFHSGVDIAQNPDKTNYAVANGRVVFAGDAGEAGNMVVIDHGIDENGRDVRTVYTHNASLYVLTGQTVAAGEAIGETGQTGQATGVHLHFEKLVDEKPVDPESFLKGCL